MVQRCLVLHFPHGLYWKVWPHLTVFFRSIFWLFFLVIGHLTPGRTELERTYCFSVAVEHIDTELLWNPHSTHRFLAHKEIIHESSRNGPFPFPNRHFNPEMMTGANIELVDVSQRGQTSPSVSIIAARQVSLSDPHGEPPSWIRGDSPPPLWPLKPQKETAGSDTVSMN